MSERSLGGQSITGGGRPSKAFTSGRICRDPNCQTKLSIYNKGKYCYSHEPAQAQRTRGRKIA